MDKLKAVEQILWLSASTLFFIANIVSTYVLFWRKHG